MRTLRLIVTSPDGHIFNEEIVMVSVRGIEGDFAVMGGHIPFVTALKPCKCRIEMPDGEEKIGEIDGGMLSVNKDIVTLLSSSFKLISTDN